NSGGGVSGPTGGGVGNSWNPTFKTGDQLGPTGGGIGKDGGPVLRTGDELRPSGGGIGRDWDPTRKKRYRHGQFQVVTLDDYLLERDSGPFGDGPGLRPITFDDLWSLGRLPTLGHGPGGSSGPSGNSGVGGGGGGGGMCPGNLHGGPSNPCGSCPNGNCWKGSAKNNAARPQVASAPANHPVATNPVRNGAPIGSTTNPGAGLHHPISPGGGPPRQIGGLGGTVPHPGGLGGLHPGGLGGLHPGGLGGLHPGGLGGLHPGGLGGFGGFRHSDIRLKQDIVPLGRLANGLKLYRFRYTGADQVYVGVMAQHVRAIAPDAVMRGRDGYLLVNYQRLGLQLQTWDEWLAASK